MIFVFLSLMQIVGGLWMPLKMKYYISFRKCRKTAVLQVWSGFTDFGLKSDFLRQCDLIREWFYSSPNSFFLSLFCILWFFTFTKRFGWAQVGLIWSNEWVVEWVLVILCNMNCAIVFSYLIWDSVRDRLLHCIASLLMYDYCILFSIVSQG